MNAHKKRIVIVGGIIAFLLVGGYFSIELVNSYVLKMISSGSLLTGDAVGAGEDKFHGLHESGNVNLQTSDTLGAKILNYRALVSEDEVKAAYDKMTNYDRLKVYYLLSKRLGKKDLELLLKLAHGGLEPNEKKLAKRIILNKLSEKEYNEIIAIAKKYGLIVEKNYDAGLSNGKIVKPKRVVRSSNRKKYYDLVSAARVELSKLQTSCSGELNMLAKQYFETKDSYLLTRGSTKVKECDYRVEIILSQLNAKLLANGFPNSIIAQLRSTYEDEKVRALNKLLDK